jgi:hypothetical protein
MKRLLFHIVIFLAPLVILLIIVPVNKRMKYLGLKNDCFNHAIWIHDRIYENPDPVDIAFLGSSHTINGINDMLLSEKLDGLNAVNFGYCRLGRNLDYVLLKEILQKKEIKKLVVEVRESEDRYSHPVFPSIAAGEDVFLPYPFFDRDILSDMWQHVAYKVELYQDSFYKADSITPFRMDDFGFAAHPDTASVAFLDEIKVKRSRPKTEISVIEKSLTNKYPEGYLKKIGKICNNNSIDLYFLFLPSYGSQVHEPAEMKIYKELGTVLLPPVQLFEDKDNWFDENHFNMAGAAKLSEWLSGELMAPRELSKVQL